MNLWVESKKGDLFYKKINVIVKTFLVQKIQGNQEIIRSHQKKHKCIKASQGTRIVWIDELREIKRQDTSMLKKIGGWDVS